MLDDKRKAPCCFCGSMGFVLGDSRSGPGDDVEELAGEVFCDGFDVGVDDGLFAGSALQIL